MTHFTIAGLTNGCLFGMALGYRRAAMSGYSKEQLEAKGAYLGDYILCDNCDLYWHKRAFKKHLRPPPRVREIGASPWEREFAPIHPVWQSLMNEIAIPFEFTVPAGPRAGRAAAKRAAGAPEAVRDTGTSAKRDSLKKHHAALLERRAKLDEEIGQAERELGLIERPPPGGSTKT